METYGKKCVMMWIRRMFNSLNDITITDYHLLPYGKKVMDNTGDYVIVYYDDNKSRVNYIFKEEEV